MGVYGELPVPPRPDLIRISRPKPPQGIKLKPLTLHPYMPFLYPAKTCDLCEKVTSDTECAVLEEMLGKDKDCFAWSDDPEWEKKANDAREIYEVRCQEWWKPPVVV